MIPQNNITPITVCLPHARELSTEHIRVANSYGWDEKATEKFLATEVPVRYPKDKKSLGQLQINQTGF